MSKVIDISDLFLNHKPRKTELIPYEPITISGYTKGYKLHFPVDNRHFPDPSVRVLYHPLHDVPKIDDAKVCLYGEKTFRWDCI